MITKALVLLATYNGQQFIAQQLQTILNQTPKPSKILINIDLSTDKTVAIVEGYATKFHLTPPTHMRYYLGVILKFLVVFIRKYIFLEHQYDLFRK